MSELKITAAVLEAIPQDIMLSIPEYMHRSIYKAIGQTRLQARAETLEEAARVAECAAGEETANTAAWAMAISIATDIRSLIPAGRGSMEGETA